MSNSNNRRHNSQKSAALCAYFPEKLRQKLSEDLQLFGTAIRLDELQLLEWMHLGWVYRLASGHAPQSERMVNESQ
ncbi:hypothetical protein Mal15_12280 [Stieleria maiorica]|uniref:Uncharacterized protein n=1 Tax=Stieleria maiorica TaxID=2795974 RepID=A0A5B9MAU9_9BACT|nr:hypothetical protein [Stieleria maiorica]QEF97190.1 hypothetical protein Mal15_12280 [Stieleria maiorica]